MVAVFAACGDDEVTIVPDLVVSVERTEISVGETVQVTAQFSPEGDAGDDDIAFSTSDPSRVSVTGAGGAATVRALASGDVTIVASGRGLTGAVSLRIVAVVERIELTPMQPRFPAGATTQLTATVVYSNGERLDVTQNALWTSDREGIATVVGGRVTGVAPGDAVISALLPHDSGRTGCTITAAVDPIAADAAPVGP